MLVAIPLAIFMGIAVLLFIQIDRVYYDRDKVEVMRNLFEERELLTNDDSFLQLDVAIEDYIRYAHTLYSPDSPGTVIRLEELHQTIIRRMREVFRNNPFVWKITFHDESGVLIAAAQDESRLKSQNNWENCLFFQTWDTPRITKLKSFNGTRAGTFVLRYTTPRGIPQIEELTHAWRVRSGFLALGIALLFGAMFWGLLLPARNVMMALDKGPQLASPFIRRPRVLIESYFNNLARDATLSIYSTALRDFVSERGLLDYEPLMQFVPGQIAEFFPVEGAAIFVFHRNGSDDDWEFESVWSNEGAAIASGYFKTELIEKFVLTPQARLSEDWTGAVHESYDDQDRPYPWFAELVHQTKTRAALLVIPTSQLKGRYAAWWRSVLSSIARELRFSMETISNQRRLILQEKSKANISLSRNLGHDLTNIIATSKLELMTVKQLLEIPREKVYESPVKQQIFAESLHSLLNNMRFLQETVNLYRSFTYLSRPKFEEIQLNDMATDVCELFKLSLSRNFRMELDLSPSLPPIKVEPRLLRLALFNLLNNAADAIKLESSTERSNGEIWLRTAPGRLPNQQTIIVEDNGGGIRDRDGRLLDQHEVDVIFQLGYTTKEQGTGEGLGLNWVFQIVREFHGGELLARNRPDGGASFAIHLPMDLDIDVSNRPTMFDATPRPTAPGTGKS